MLDRKNHEIVAERTWVFVSNNTQVGLVAECLLWFCE
jgi:hypothetical protein